MAKLEKPLSVGGSILFEAGVRPAMLADSLAEDLTPRQCQMAVDRARRKARTNMAGYVRTLIESGADLDPHVTTVSRPPDQATRLRRLQQEAEASAELSRRERENAATDDERRAALATWRGQKRAQTSGTAAS